MWNYKRSLIFYLLFVFPICYPLWEVAYAKTARGGFRYKSKGFRYLTNFGCAIGTCKWKIRVKLIDPWKSVSRGSESSPHATHWDEDAKALQNFDSTTMTVRVMLDVKWESSEVGRRPSCLTMDLSHDTLLLQIPLNGRWSGWITGDISQVVRPHVWYFILDDCSGVISNRIADVLKLPYDSVGHLNFQWEFEALQENKSHFSYELFGTIKVALFHTLCYGAVLVAMSLYQVREMKRSGRIHKMIQLLNACVALQMSSSILHIVHIWAYDYNGYGLPVVDGIAETLAVISQIVMSSVMIFIAMGYTLNVPSALEKVKSIGLPIVLIITLIHVGLVWLDRFNADPRFKFHSSSGFLGFMLALFRLVLWIGFLSQGLITMNHDRTPSQVRVFLQRFIVAASLYFLAYPVVFGITCLVPPYLQHKFITNAIFMMQLGSMLWLCILFLRKGEYFKISDLSQSYLPGGYLSSRGVQRLD